MDVRLHRRRAVLVIGLVVGMVLAIVATTVAGQT